MTSTQAANSPPFGVIDTPADNVKVSGAIGITGWAVGASIVTKVEFWRESVAAEPPGVLVYISDATLVPGARPDVAKAVPGYPNNDSGWGAQILTNELPGTGGLPMGNGTYRIHVIARDSAGQSAELGIRTLNADNQHSIIPFGTIDTPGSGELVSGPVYINFGWALTPQPNIIPADGSTITVFIDDIPVGHPAFGFDRSDISTLFPGLRNTHSGVGYYFIDTTKLTDGLHQIAWSVSDAAGNLNGIGSRLFRVRNVTSVFTANPIVVPTTGTAPLTVSFTAGGVYSDGQILRYRWSFFGNGTFDTDDPGVITYTRTFTQAGTYNALLEVTNDKGKIVTATVPIVVSNPPPIATAAVSPSNGAVPLSVTLTGTGTPTGNASISKYEWDPLGTGAFSYSSTTSGTTSFTYTTPGNYQAVFRVTDNHGQTATAIASTTAIRAGPVGSPTAKITTPTGSRTGQAPFPVSFAGTGTPSSGRTIVKYEYDYEGTGAFVTTPTSAGSHTYSSPGAFTAAFRVTDSQGASAIDTLNITVTINATLTVSADTLRPPGTLTVNTTISGTAPVTIFIKNKVGQTVRTLVNGVSRTSGSYTDSWDGSDAAGALVPEGEYFAVLRYSANGIPVTLDQTTTTGNVFYNPSWQLSTTQGGSCYNCPFAPYSNNFLQATFSLSQASEVTVSIRGFDTENEVARLFDHRPFGRSKSYTVAWEGTNSVGQIVHPSLYNDSQFIFGMTAVTLPTNAVFVERTAELSNVSVSPNYYDPFTSNFISPQRPVAVVTYSLSKLATVRLQVYRVGTNVLLRTISVGNASPGTGTINWDGKDDYGTFVDKGDYRLALKAIDPSGGESLVRYLLVRVLY